MNDIALTILKAVILFFTLLLITRILGKKLIGQLTFFDFVAGITLGTLTASTVLGSVPAGVGAAGLIMWAFLTFFDDAFVLFNCLPGK